MCIACIQILEKVSPNPKEILQKKALENPTKNRSDDYLPSMYIITIIYYNIINVTIEAHLLHCLITHR